MSHIERNSKDRPITQQRTRRKEYFSLICFVALQWQVVTRAIQYSKKQAPSKAGIRHRAIQDAPNRVRSVS